MAASRARSESQIAWRSKETAERLGVRLEKILGIDINGCQVKFDSIGVAFVEIAGIEFRPPLYESVVGLLVCWLPVKGEGYRDISCIEDLGDWLLAGRR